MIVSFKDRATEHFYHGRPGKGAKHFPPDVLQPALRKLDMLNAARRLDDLRALPGNRLEVLKGTLKGFHSIRINAQWRVVFRWADGDAYDVAVTDDRKRGVALNAAKHFRKRWH
jgi:proteic killer suppression protein